MALDLIGKIIQKLDVQSGEGARGTWQRQDIVIETVEQYPKKVCVELWNESIREVEKYALGDIVTISVNITSREYNGKWYTSVRAWRVQAQSGGGTAPAQSYAPQQPQAAPANDIPAPTADDFLSNAEDKIDDLPF